MKIAKHFILQLRAGYHILAYEVLISGRVSEIRGLGVGAAECAAVGILPRWFKGVCSLASACFIAPFVLIIQQRRHYGAYLVAATDRPTVHKVKRGRTQMIQREKGTQERVVALGGRSKKVTTTLKSKTRFSIFKEETTTRTQDRN